ncbi:MAG: hypothetical protein CM1200mP29_17130 [Verrucomicrobiota bacterium]|nr:MAG: hypothetical protein CM1200mP29_17130 [Verrucomicrobiota bacterium]
MMSFAMLPSGLTNFFPMRRKVTCGRESSRESTWLTWRIFPRCALMRWPRGKMSSSRISVLGSLVEAFR